MRLGQCSLKTQSKVLLYWLSCLYLLSSVPILLSTLTYLPAPYSNYGILPSTIAFIFCPTSQNTKVGKMRPLKSANKNCGPTVRWRRHSQWLVWVRSKCCMYMEDRQARPLKIIQLYWKHLQYTGWFKKILNFVRLYYLNYSGYVNDLRNIWKRRS